MAKDKIKGMLIGSVLTFGVMLSFPSIAQVGESAIKAYYNNIKIVVDGKQVVTENEPFIYEGRTYLPVRDIGNALNKNINWDNNTKTVSIDSGTNNNNQNNNQNNTLISQAQANTIALNRVGGGNIVKSYLDYDDGYQKYEITIIWGMYEYDIDVDARTGNIISYEMDHIYD